MKKIEKEIKRKEMTLVEKKERKNDRKEKERKEEKRKNST